MSIRRRIFVFVCIAFFILLVIWVINLFVGALGGINDDDGQQPEAVMVSDQPPG